MSLSSYLASKYLNAEPASANNKKRNRKGKKSASSGLTIADDDVLGWSSQPKNNEPYPTDEPLAVGSGPIELKAAKKNTWKKIGESASQLKGSDADEAEKIIAQAAAENSAAQQQGEQEPVFLEGIVKMENGTHAGLQSASDIAKQFEKRRQEEKKAWKEENSSKGPNENKETVYRDATGRRIDLVMRRQEAQREAKIKMAKEREEREAQGGDFQRAEKEKRREQLDEVRFLPLTRTIEDEEMNKELKNKERWNDPASRFMTPKEGGKSSSGMPLYVGAAAPNRYGIRPGYRWDGVDRGNGWEAERFKALNNSVRNKELSYTWQMDE
ncbi:Pre-mRNA-splicing factor cwc26 [Golovinomyces cichoracearum]|uniref:Pre-mRNA-splicing factor cwc26 n=1 Tax=Golovinomyces cichoracearum TaxID=62708 RepID=A0A420J7N6_9PEZI|nr:Pre-mRNA-splicing factor cwc26 [Golovinomyces cichoracearum]